MKIWKEQYQKDSERLELFTTAISRVHKEAHPETVRVRELYEALGRTDKPQEIFEELREITSSYSIPADVCPTFVNVYETLKMYDQLYEKEGI